MSQPTEQNEVVSEEEDMHDAREEQIEPSEDWEMAKKGVIYVLNNRIKDAYLCFQDRESSLKLAAGHAYVTFLAALMTFEESVIEGAFSELKDLERRCASSLGWLKSVKSKLNSKRRDGVLEEQIILADCQVLLAVLNGLVNDNAGSYVKSGWALRKAWRIYQSTYSHLLKLYKQTFGVATLPGSLEPKKHYFSLATVCENNNSKLDNSSSGSGNAWRLTLERGLTPDSPTCPWTFPQTPSTPAAGSSDYGYMSTFWNLFSSAASPSELVGLSEHEVSRLMGAVSFGYGLFLLMVSLLPPSLSKLMQLLGFSCDRNQGIDALMFARLGTDMRAPLATLALLWYHTIVRPFYAVDGHNVSAGADAANLLILETKDDFSRSSIFLFFKARILRLKSDVDQAVNIYLEASKLSQQRELQLLCLHEIAWCRLIQLKFEEAGLTFHQLSSKSNWGTHFYNYCNIICWGAAGRSPPDKKRLKHPSTNARNSRELDVMIEKRLTTYLNQPRPSYYYRLLAYELLYMWNNMTYSKYTSQLIQDCEELLSEAEDGSVVEEPMVGLGTLILGVCLASSEEYERAEQCFLDVLKARRSLPTTAPDAHIDVFTYYELAILKLRTPQTLKEAQIYLNRITLYRDYDLENQLSLRIHVAMKQAHMEKDG